MAYNEKYKRILHRLGDYDYQQGLIYRHLNQLEALPLKILKIRSSADEEEFLRLRGEIQQKHLDFLSVHKSVLITDTSEIFTDKSGKVTEMESIMINLPERESREEWTWDFDLRRSDYYEKSSVFKVVALILKS